MPALATEGPRLAAAAGVALISTSVNLATPLVQGRIIERLAAGASLAHLRPTLLLLAGLYCFDPAFTQLYVRLVTHVGEAVSEKLRRSVFELLIRQPQAFFDEHSPASLTAIVCADLDAVRTVIMMNASRDRGLRAALETLGALAALSWTNPRLGTLLGTLCLLSGAAAFRFRSSAGRAERSAAAARAKAATQADEAFAGARTLRAYGAMALASHGWAARARELRDAGVVAGAARATLECGSRSAVHLALLALYAGGSALVVRGRLPISTLMSSLGYTYVLVFSAQGILQTAVDIRAAAGSLGRVQDLIGDTRALPSEEAGRPSTADADAETAVDGVGGCEMWRERPPLSVEGEDGVDSGVDAEAPPAGSRDDDAAPRTTHGVEVRFEDVWFAYPSAPNRPVLKGISLTLQPGKVTALVGRSGSGKSSLAALLERAYEPTSGRLLIDGCDASTVPREEWPLIVVPVAQDALLFEGSIADNVALGGEPRRLRDAAAGIPPADPASEARANYVAAHAAGVTTFSLLLPEGLDAPVGSRGRLLSGGQRQRVAIARAFRSPCPVAVLDEPTSALDAEAEAIVAAAVARLAREGRTVLLVAHRLATVRHAHQIVVLDAGRVAERGTHGELEARGGIYASLLAAHGSGAGDGGL